MFSFLVYLHQNNASCYFRCGGLQDKNLFCEDKKNYPLSVFFFHHLLSVVYWYRYRSNKANKDNIFCQYIGQYVCFLRC